MRSAASTRQAWRLIPLVLGMALPGCRDATGPSDDELDPPDVSAYVTGAAAAALGPDGTFLPIAGQSPNGETIISAERARTLAVAYVKTAVPVILPGLETQRGGPIDPSALTLSRRVYFAQTPYARFPDEGFHPAMARLYGPAYLMTVLERGRPVIEIAVAALATDYGVDANGWLVMPPLGGNDFSPLAFPDDGHVYRPLTPEMAVALAAGATGAKVVASPTLQLRGRPYSRLVALWRIDLDRDVTAHVAATGRAVVTRTIYVGPEERERFMIPSPEQPTTYRSTGTKVSATYEYLGDFPFEIGIRAGWPVTFDAVTVTPGAPSGG